MEAKRLVDSTVQMREVANLMISPLALGNRPELLAYPLDLLWLLGKMVEKERKSGG